MFNVLLLSIIWIPFSILLPRQCQGDTVYLSLWHWACLHPSVLMPVQQTIRVNQFLLFVSLPVPDCLFVCSPHHCLSSSVPLFLILPSICSEGAENLVWLRFQLMLWGLYTCRCPFLPASAEWAVWIVYFLNPVALCRDQVNSPFIHSHSCSKNIYKLSFNLF